VRTGLAALLDHHAHGKVHVRSAGSSPADQIHDNVREVMDEMGLNLSKEFPKPLTDEVVRAADVVVTMGGRCVPGLSWKALRRLGLAGSSPTASWRTFAASGTK
jgi:protein-tyrosine-phosphatase